MEAMGGPSEAGIEKRTTYRNHDSMQWSSYLSWNCSLFKSLLFQLVRQLFGFLFLTTANNCLLVSSGTRFPSNFSTEPETFPNELSYTNNKQEDRQYAKDKTKEARNWSATSHAYSYSQILSLHHQCRLFRLRYFTASSVSFKFLDTEIQPVAVFLISITTHLPRSYLSNAHIISSVWQAQFEDENS
jgi:hypothetical protein